MDRVSTYCDESSYMAYVTKVKVKVDPRGRRVQSCVIDDPCTDYA